MPKTPIDLISDHLDWLRRQIEKGFEDRERHHAHEADRNERAADEARRKDQRDFDNDMDRITRRYLPLMNDDAPAALQGTTGDHLGNLLTKLSEALGAVDHDYAELDPVIRPFVEGFLRQLPPDSGVNLRRAVTIGAFAMLMDASSLM